MKFNYCLKGHCWADVLNEIDLKKIQFNPSYLTDALGDLLCSLVSLLIEVGGES
jgi:hypothetical protein